MLCNLTNIKNDDLYDTYTANFMIPQSDKSSRSWITRNNIQFNIYCCKWWWSIGPATKSWQFSTISTTSSLESPKYLGQKSSAPTIPHRYPFSTCAAPHNSYVRPKKPKKLPTTSQVTRTFPSAVYRATCQEPLALTLAGYRWFALLTWA